MPRIQWSEQAQQREKAAPSAPSHLSESDSAFVERLTAELEDAIKEYRRWRFQRRIRGILRTAILLAIALTIFQRQWGPFIWMMVLFGGSEMTDRQSSRRRQVATLLARTRDPRAVNVLALAVASRDPATRAVASDALKRILPALKASDSRYITPEGLKALCWLLNPNRLTTASLMLAVLEALKQVGTPACIPAVERLQRTPYPIRLLVRVTEKWHISAVRDTVQRLQDSAAECLEVLRTREKAERDRATLLRPAERPEDEDMLLLRPVMGSRPSDDLTLVRPADDTTPTADAVDCAPVAGVPGEAEADEVARRLGAEGGRS